VFHNIVGNIEDEFARLEKRPAVVTGPEYVYRSSVLRFALMMARIYANQFPASLPKTIDKIEQWLERAEKL
jgi:hypothetical protein